MLDFRHACPARIDLSDEPNQVAAQSDQIGGGQIGFCPPGHAVFTLWEAVFGKPRGSTRLAPVVHAHTLGAIGNAISASRLSPLAGNNQVIEFIEGAPGSSVRLRPLGLLRPRGRGVRLFKHTRRDRTPVLVVTKLYRAERESAYQARLFVALLDRM